MKFEDNPNVIDLMDFENPDCASCEEPTKRVSAKTFDVEGPGRVGVIYDCDNRQCKSIKNAKGVFLMRSLRGEI